MLARFLIVAIALLTPSLSTVVEAENKRESLRRFAVGTQKIELTWAQHLNVDCQLVGEMRLATINAPKSGKLIPVARQYFSNFAKGSPREKCNANRTHAFAVDYVANEGFKGEEKFSFGIVFNDGTIWRYDVDLTVY